MSAAGINAGKAFIRLGLKEEYVAQLKRAQAKFRAFGSSLQALGTRIAATGVKLAVPGAIALGVFAKFDEQIAKLAAITGAAGESIDKLRDKAKEMGSTTSFSASQAAEAMTFLGMAGYNTQQILAGIGPVLSLAAAGALELGTAADIASDVASAFGLTADEIGRVADVLATGATSANTNVEMMGETFKYVAPLAAAAGQSIEDTSAAIGALADKGIKASMAGTDLALILKTFANPAAAKKLASLGVQLTDASGNFRKLPEIIRDISNATSELSESARLGTFSTVFGRAAKSMAILTADVGKLDELSGKMDRASGAAERMAATMLNNLLGAGKLVMSAMEGVAIAIGEALATPLTKLARAFARALSMMTKLIDAFPIGVQAFAGLTVAALALGGGLIGVAVAAKIAAIGIGVVVSAIGMAKGVVTAGVIAINAMRAASLLMTAAFSIAQGSVVGMTVAMGLLNAANAISPAFTAMATTGFTILGAALTALTGPASLATVMAGIVGAAWSAAGTAAAAAWAVITAPITVALTVIAASIAVVVAAMTMFAGAVAAVAVKAGLFADAWNYAKSVLAGVWKIASETFAGIRAAMAAGQYAKAAQVMWAGIKAAFWSGTVEVLRVAANLWDTLAISAQKFGVALIQTLANVFRSIPRLLKAALTGGSISAELSKAFSGMNVSFGQYIERQAAKAKHELRQLREEAENATKAAERTKKDKSRQDAMSDALDLPSGPASAAVAERGPDDVFANRIQSLKEETFALKHGADAAERWRLAQMGLTGEQLTAIKAMQTMKAGLADMKEEAQRRIDKKLGLENRASQLNDQYKSPFKRLQDELGELKELRGNGLGDVAYQAEIAKAKKRFLESGKEAKTRTSNIGTFSGFAAGRMGGGNPVQDRIAKATEETAAESKKTREAIEKQQGNAFQE